MQNKNDEIKQIKSLSVAKSFIIIIQNTSSILLKLLKMLNKKDYFSIIKQKRVKYVGVLTDI